MQIYKKKSTQQKLRFILCTLYIFLYLCNYGEKYILVTSIAKYHSINIIFTLLGSTYIIQIPREHSFISKNRR